MMAVLVWAPLPFGSNRVWASSVLCIAICLLATVWLVLHSAGQVRIDPQVWRRARLPLGLLLLVQLWVLVQIMPLPRTLVEVLSPQAYGWHVREGWLTISLDWAQTKNHLLQGAH